MRRTTASERLFWPPWLEMYADDFANELWCEVTYKDQVYRWQTCVPFDPTHIMPVAAQVRAGMIQREQLLDQITQRLKE